MSYTYFQNFECIWKLSETLSMDRVWKLSETLSMDRVSDSMILCLN
ncbi:hypothetical protein LEP1GSC120_2762 [Leptospira santarosai str. 200702252]|nr:hypothetical protein LEP1GSC163_1557 [Leptospira santarosai str. CBC379]EMO69674.1 hypothetical protein LEP1GSC130_0100 [Leptospira santarosai str. 200403458]EMP00033.1 hypothetical protein LEP1GSC120_2762 [Leptospira santarosai str. 200702252]